MGTVINVSWGTIFPKTTTVCHVKITVLGAKLASIAKNARLDIILLLMVFASPAQITVRFVLVKKRVCFAVSNIFREWERAFLAWRIA